MKRTPRWKVATAGVLAAATAVLGVACLAALSHPVKAGFGSSFGLASGFDRQALRRIEGPRATAANLDAAAIDARNALSLSPYDNSARLTLTYIDTLRHGALRTGGVTYLSQSYDLVPYDHTVAAWRVRFALEHWSALPVEEREAVRSEAMAFLRAGSHDLDIRGVLASIRDPSGRLAAALWIGALQH